jgi:cobalt-precorrin-5B (C1)-methyltransferase
METPRNQNSGTALRRGWTTGACATAATKAALTALITGEFPDPVEITLPKGETPQFPLSIETFNDAGAMAGIVKDAGDDPDVTHGATILSHVVPLPRGSGVVFKAGQGVGMVTKAGLPIPPGEAAINPVPRQMMRDIVGELCAQHMMHPDIQITISVPGGEELAKQTWNPRLGIVGGLSILGTTGIVHPFSCSAWIHSIHRGIDVARAAGFNHVIAATGSTSEATAQKLYGLPDTALLDMGDFAGGVLKYIRKHPVPHLTIAGGFAKLAKLAQGALDLHSGRSQVDFHWLAEQIESLHQRKLEKSLNKQILNANTASEILELIQHLNIDLPAAIAFKAKQTSLAVLRGASIEIDVIVIDRQGEILARV